jgi:hypothetical protein
VVFTVLVRLVAAFLVVDPLVEVLFDAVVLVEVFFLAAEARVVVFFALLDDVVVVLALRVRVPPLVFPSLVASTAFFVPLVERRELAPVDSVVACPACASTVAAFLRVLRRVVVPFC